MAITIGRKRKLLQHLSTLTHNDRVRHMSELGRDGAGTKELRKLLSSLVDDQYQWQLRLYAATAAGEVDDIVEGFASPLRSVRSLAIMALERLDVGVETVSGAINELPAADRRAVLTALRRKGDAEAADRLILPVHERFGAEEASVLLPACSEAVASRWLPQLAHAMSSWPSVVRAHPAVFVDFLRSEMSTAPIVRDLWWVTAAPGMSELVDLDPIAALDLWAEFGSGRSIPAPIAGKLPRLATADADRTFRLLLEPDRRKALPAQLRSLRRRIRTLDRELVAEVAQAVVQDQSALATVLGAVAPSERAALFEYATAGLDTSQIAWVPNLLQVLPHEVRHREARRMLELPMYRDNADAHSEVLQWLPIAETWETLRSATATDDADRRAAAYRRLVIATISSRDRVFFGQLLSELERLRNEQDPVRAVALGALSQCPVDLVDLQAMDTIDTFVTFVIEARDTSAQTTRSLSVLLQRVLVSSATEAGRPRLERCVDALARLAGRNGTIELGVLHRNLPAGGEFVLYGALEERIRADLGAGRANLLFGLMHGLGSRAHAVPQFEEHLETLIRSGFDNNALQAIPLYVSAPGDLTRRLGALLAWEPSAVLVGPVFGLVSLARQDLIDAALSKEALSGRFAPTESRRHVPLIEQGLYRWVPRQRFRYAELLSAAISNENTGFRRMSSIRTLARIPEIGTEQIRPLVDSTDVVTVEAALAGLAWGETPADELDTLLAHVNGDRARVAVYAATRAGRYAPPVELERALAQVLHRDDTRLTARKEALRILGQNRTPGAMDVFSALWSERPLHRSVAIALASALRNYPDEDLTWEVYDEFAVGGHDTAFALTQVLAPLTWPDQRRAQVAEVALQLGRHESEPVRAVAFGQLADLRPWNDDISAVLLDAVSDLSTIASWRSARGQIYRLLDGFPSDAVLVDAVELLATQAVPAAVSDDPGRDLPVRQRLDVLSHDVPRTAQGRATKRQAAMRLVAGGYAAEAVSFYAWSIDWDAPVVRLREVVELAQNHATAVPRVYPVIHQVVTGGLRDTRLVAGDLIDVARELASGDEPSGLAAIAIVNAAGPTSGWAQPWRDVLASLRTHDSVWVRSQALQTRSAAE